MQRGQLELIALVERHRRFNKETDRTKIALASLDSPLALVIVTGMVICCA